ncbi:MAG TPA: methyltransferase domain-containing protein [Acetobacteraceae bacterium]|jgi:SAM-dependent methyltransferase|nr:methyltransferase domain-containing protein [Acetobacteraceae bacterium]
MSEALPFEPHRFRSAAAHYRAGRTAYPPLLIRRTAERAGVTPAHRVLDLGCGPGPLAIGFSYFAGEVVAVDPEPAMLEEARAAAAGLAPDIIFREGSSYDLDAAPGRFRLVVIGRAFHWMDRADTLRRLDAMIEPGGAVALFDDTHADVPQNAWRDRWRELVDRYAAGDPVHDRRRVKGAWVRHLPFLLDSAFSRIERLSVFGRRLATVQSLVDRAMSMSSTSRARLGEARADALIADLDTLLREIAPSGVLEEVLEWSATIATRQPT